MNNNKTTETDDTNNIDETNEINKNEKINEINEIFKLPIYYNDLKMPLKQNIIDDLELTKTIDLSCNSIYTYGVNNDNKLSTAITNQMSTYYTPDVNFLKDNQLLLKNYKKLNNKYNNYSPDYENIINIWYDVIDDEYFKDKYNYFDWPMLEFLNKSDIILLCFTLCNITSPIISLFTPIIILIIPFIFIKIKGLELTITEYMTLLSILAQQHAVGKLLFNFNNVDIQEKVYLSVSFAFYIYSLYQNTLICIKTYHNIIKIHKYINEINVYLDHTIETINNYKIYSSNLNTHSKFNSELDDKLKILIGLKDKIKHISEFKLNFKNVYGLGYVFKSFYELQDNSQYIDALIYSFGFNGYIDCIEGLISNIQDKKMNFCDFITENKKSVFKKSYYACLKNTQHTKNTISLNKNMIITGPNASGKTTILKSTLINIIFSQQFGCGFYDTAKLCPFKYIHCYLNIPDTSGRDSLFQAEARRCKEIIDIIDFNKEDKHFCVFDEIYSGTNPEEAVVSATSFLKYLVKNKNVSCLITTHFIKICKNLKNDTNFANFNMDSIVDNNKNLTHKYKIVKGISNIKGGIQVLRKLNYPKEIMNSLVN
jgi:hypothetical protein